MKFNARDSGYTLPLSTQVAVEALALKVTFVLAELPVVFEQGTPEEALLLKAPPTEEAPAVDNVLSLKSIKPVMLGNCSKTQKAPFWVLFFD